MLLRECKVGRDAVRFDHDVLRFIRIKLFRHQVAQSVVFLAMYSFAHPFHQFFELDVGRQRLIIVYYTMERTVELTRSILSFFGFRIAMMCTSGMIGYVMW